MKWNKMSNQSFFRWSRVMRGPKGQRGLRGPRGPMNSECSEGSKSQECPDLPKPKGTRIPEKNLFHRSVVRSVVVDYFTRKSSCVASARYAALSNGGVPHPVLDRGGTPFSPGQGGYRIQSWLGGYPIQSWLGGVPPSQSKPGMGVPLCQLDGIPPES